VADVQVLIRLSLELLPDAFLGDPDKEALVLGVVLR